MFEDLFHQLYEAKNEQQIEQIIARYSSIFLPENWHPLGDIESNFGIVENQQSNPIAALVEKITNSIDAILMRKCLEAGIDPKSTDAPQSVEAAIERFFPDHKNWDLSQNKNRQAENIQILADSEPRDTANTSLIIYDDGEGQCPQDFEATFLSLLRGNKNEIRFVQGKYNMGGSGAIVFCGKQRYQLIASKRYDGRGDFGFTLIRKHPLTEAEAQIKKNTWYEYFKVGENIPSFPCKALDLNLQGRLFRSGTIIKLYSYDLRGNKHIRRDLGRSLNEFLYEPALPIYLIESVERYPNDRGLTSAIYGLKRRLNDHEEYIEATFSEDHIDKRIGKMKITVHVFKARAKGKKPSDTRNTIQNEFFKNGMAVLFSVNGQVHGHYTSEFITRTLKFNLLRDYLLIHVDCTEMNYQFRSELFMASRDRQKQGEEASTLRQVLGNNLKTGRLKEIYKARKDNISVDNIQDDNFLQGLVDQLSLNNEFQQLLNVTFKLDQVDKPSKPRVSASNKNLKTKNDKQVLAFNPQRFPTFFNLSNAKPGKDTVVNIPLNGEKTLRFESDVENQYFDRIEEPGELKLAVLKYRNNDITGGTDKGPPREISDIFSVTNASPNEGTIKVVFNPTDEVQVGDEMQIKVDLTNPGNDFSEIFWVKITESQAKQKEKVEEPENIQIGLPKLIKVYELVKDEDDNAISWGQLNDSGIDMGWNVVLHPVLEDDVLEKIYINMDSSTLKNYKSQWRNITPEQSQTADNHYISAMYTHTLLLYIINKKRNYQISKGESGENISLDDYLKDIFSSNYAAFLLNFGTSGLMEALD